MEQNRLNAPNIFANIILLSAIIVGTWKFSIFYGLSEYINNNAIIVIGYFLIFSVIAGLLIGIVFVMYTLNLLEDVLYLERDNIYIIFGLIMFISAILNGMLQATIEYECKKSFAEKINIEDINFKNIDKKNECASIYNQEIRNSEKRKKVLKSKEEEFQKLIKYDF